LLDGHCVGAEVLLRWQHPELGTISPGEFAPIIEQSPHIGKMTAWVLDAALRQASLLKSRGVIIPVSVNISAANLDEPDFVQRVQLALLRHGIRPAMLELEVTESAIMKDAANALAKLQALSDGGVRLSIDDFGTGYSSLSYLQTLPTTVVKIDQSFIRSMGDGFRENNLVRSMIQLSHDLGYQVVAEGVETLEAAEALSKMGCDEAQGYLFAKPLSPAAFEEWFFDRKVVHKVAC
jgi:EAL domain-containing protein (putative c-di-GMP-specific phosphodiesterase class I)